jgi:uncharacterized protein YjbI with pentapeptide repeats
MKWWLIGASGVTLVAGAIALALALSYDHLSPYFQGVATESAGVFLDALLLVAVLGAYEQFRGRREELARLRERIEDVKRIDDPQARGILGSSIRALARLKHTDIDLRGAQLTGFSFPENDISSLVGTVISDGLYLSRVSRNFARLKEVDFTEVDCTGVMFGKGDLSLGLYENCTFHATKLVGARFEGASLHWDQDKVPASESDWYTDEGETEDGHPIRIQHYNPAFDGADLAGCRFDKARFRYADFRGARNVKLASFVGATGLETCFFDEGDRPAESEH